MTENQKLMDLAGILTASHDHSEVMEIIVSSAAEIFNADRACVILKTKEDKLSPKSGFPKGAHILGVDLLPETGEFFFREVLAMKGPQFVEDVATDPRTVYLGPLVKLYGITSIFVIPILHHDEPLGVLILDFVNDHRASEDALNKAQFLSHVAAIAIWKEKMNILEQEKAPLYDLGMNVAGVSHKIGNRVTHIKGFADLALEETDPAKIKEHLKVIYRAACDIDNFVAEVRYFSRPGDLKSETLNISEFLIDEITEISILKYFEGVEFQFELDPDLPAARVYPLHLRDCIYSILMNAVHAMVGVERKRIIVKSHRSEDGKNGIVSLANSGEIIDPSLEDKIFDSWVTTKEDGTGLGLATAKTIVEMFHGGKIWVVREPMTEFFISIPLS